uniref:EOG090X0FS7 n=1 Tax=Daphnia similis TaxID=35528 RepID=A0A4Y7N5X2_9CRUS|nr:EOG090X0FS7 [Daphnia similis]
MPSNKNGYISSYSSTSETVGSDRKKIVNDFVSTAQNKTPNKSGLTPIRPTKSPGNGMKLKSGLTPEEDSVATNSTSNEDLAQLPAAEELVCGAKKSLETKNPIKDLDEAALQLGMSGSYSEILSPAHFKTEVVDDAKPAIQNLAVEGTVVQEGDMIHFIAKNLESKIRLSSPDISEASQIVSQSDLVKHGQPIATPESTFLAQLERDARSIAASVDGLTEHLAVSLHTISAVTAQSLTVYKDSVCKTCDAMDSNIKSMYQLMAKCEELSKSMTPIYKLADQVKEIKKLLDIMENLS